MNARDIGLACAAVALALDQGSKLLILYGLHFIDPDVHHTIQILPFFNLVMLWNPCISYGICIASGTLGTVLIVILVMAAVAGLGWWLWHSERKILGAGLGLVIGGALGNLIDRLVYTRVADFFHFYVGRFDWYVFNIADCAIAVGVVALLYDAVRQSEPQADGTKG